MSFYLNYLIEANLGLVAFLILYILLLRNETNFTFKRWFVLAGIGASLLFPFIKFPAPSATLPTLNSIVAPYLLPEVVIRGTGQIAAPAAAAVPAISVVQWIYLGGVGLLLIIFVVKFTRIVRYLQTSVTTHLEGKFKIIESPVPLPTFSFFNHIFIGHAATFSDQEKKDIIAHEIIHATQLHSLDILLVEFLNIIFWFNPAVYFFRKILNNIHEFQVDEQVTQHTDVSQYCSLLAKVALLSADFPLASHFNNSLTLKRIAMMNTLKTKIRKWKLWALASLVGGLFIFVACQDQVTDVVKNNLTLTQTSNFPPQVAEDIRIYQANHPEDKAGGSFTYLTGDIEEVKKLAADTYAGQKVVGTYLLQEKGAAGLLLHDVSHYADQMTERNAAGEEIFTIVEEPASPDKGMVEFVSYIAKNLKYPESARSAGIEGKVFIEFVVYEDGSIHDVHIKKGIHLECDKEAARVVAQAPPWNPGKQRGKAVKQRMVMPILFKLDTDASSERELELPRPVEADYKIEVSSSVAGNHHKISGTVVDTSGKPISGMNIVIRDTTNGSVTDGKGQFQIDTEQPAGSLVFSFVGYQTKEVSF